MFVSTSRGMPRPSSARGARSAVAVLAVAGCRRWKRGRRAGHPALWCAVLAAALTPATLSTQAHAASANEASLAIGALAIGDSTGEVVYAGTGEGNGGTSQYGQGVLKSVDGGEHWELLGQATLAGLHVASMAVDRETSGSTQHVFAATE